MLKLKVCGLKDIENYNAITELQPDFVGLNFYAPSPRFVGKDQLYPKPKDVALAGIFVDQTLNEITEIAEQFGLDFLQLHGNESPAVCEELKRRNYKVIKAFQVAENFDYDDLEPYLENCEYFLFDTAGKAPGGNGYVFNWNILNNYPYEKPYFLAGGLSPDNINKVLDLSLPKLFALDINSGFELEPGKKDVKKVKELKDKMYDSSR